MSLETAEEAVVKSTFGDKALALVSGICVEGVVAAAIVSLVPAETKAQRIKRAVGAHVIASMIAEQGSNWSVKSFREIKQALSEGIKRAEEAKAANEEEVLDD